MKRLSKKGIAGIEWTGEVILQLIVALLLLASAVAYIKAQINTTQIDKNILEEDIAPILESTPPGNFLFIYGSKFLDTDKFKVNIKQGLISIHEEDEKPVTRVFSTNNNFKYKLGEVTSNPFTITKSGNTISLKNLDPHMINCKSLKLDKSKYTNLFIDPGGNPASEKKIGNLKESEITSRVAFSIATPLESFSKTYSRETNDVFQLLQDLERVELSKLQDKIKKSDISISINVGEINNPNINYIKAYYPYSDSNSHSFSCVLVNSILEEIPDVFDAVSIVPVNMDIAPDYLQLYLQKQYSIYLEIGNSISTNHILNNEEALKKIGKGISDGIKEVLI